MEPKGQVVGVVFVFIAAMVPIILRIWTRHQERMAEIMYKPGVKQQDSEVSQLRGEVSELKELVHQQIIALDSIHREPLKERLEQKN